MNIIQQPAEIKSTACNIKCSSDRRLELFMKLGQRHTKTMLHCTKECTHVKTNKMQAFN